MVAVDPIRLADYTPWPFALPEIALDVDLRSDQVVVTSRLSLEPLSTNVPLILRGVELTLDGLAVDGEPLDPSTWIQEGDRLTVTGLPDRPFVLTTRCSIDPFNNTSLEGLYASGGMLTTQCEAEGFRRITFHPDRPDVLSRWRVRIEADRHRYPVLLSNGNAVQSLELGSDRHAVLWEDPFPKPLLFVCFGRRGFTGNP